MHDPTKQARTRMLINAMLVSTLLLLLHLGCYITKPEFIQNIMRGTPAIVTVFVASSVLFAFALFMNMRRRGHVCGGVFPYPPRTFKLICGSYVFSSIIGSLAAVNMDRPLNGIVPMCAGFSSGISLISIFLNFMVMYYQVTERPACVSGI